MLTVDQRPFKFSEMIGQKGIISEMKKRSKTMNFPEVMIFEGQSGTGKTTLAYIIASLINDPNPIINEDGSKDPNPESLSSKAVRSERFNRDIKLYDASSMGKDDVLSLGQSIQNAPLYDKNKVIIIDEAQELSKAGKGVTLELLEKKRKGCYIILCTMNLDSFDKAVKSRGQVYTFRSPPPTQIAELLLDYTEKLKLPDDLVEFYEKGIFIIAENCEGSVRNALQNFERCVEGEFFTVKEIESEFSFISTDRMADLLLKIVKKDCSVIKDLKEFGTKDFFYKSMKALNNAFLYKTTGYIDASWKKAMAEQLGSYDLESLLNYYFKVNELNYFQEDVYLFYLGKYLSGGTKLSEAPKPIRKRVPVGK